MTDDDKRLTNLRPFQKGQGGRPKGSRNKLGEAFLDELFQDFTAHGPAAIVRCREENPAVYLKIIASLLPRQLNVDTNPYDEMSDDDLLRRIRELNALIGPDRLH